MKTIKVSEATNIQLDWLVWKCAGGAAAYPKTASGPAFKKLWRGNSAKYIHPSTDWSQGGPIIEREGIDLYCNVPSSVCENTKHWTTSWRAKYHRCGVGSEMFYGTTPLIAAMRCYVTSKLGETVEVPEELV